MKDLFQVSVIVPVYNAERYLRNAVESAVDLPEVGEVLLVEDKSPDNALEICKNLAAEYRKVRLLQHPNFENRGAGASRNLGIANAVCDYIAFLDADDWYLPDRFHAAKSIFNLDAAVDGVYDATGYFCQSTNQIDADKLTTVAAGVLPEELLFRLLKSDTGRFHTNAITLRKSVFRKSGLFNSSLRLHQDTELWLRLASVGRLIPGNLTSAVAIRRVHDMNRIHTAGPESRKLLFNASFKWFEQKSGVDKRALRLLFKRFLYANYPQIPRRVFFVAAYFTLHPSRLLNYL